MTGIMQMFLGNVFAPIPRGLFAGGFRSPSYNIIDYVTITTLGNAIDFGDLSVGMTDGASCSSQTIGVFTGQGNTVAEKVTILTTGNATTFGSPVQPTVQGSTAACSNSTRGLFAGAYAITAYWNVINYITFASGGGTTSFGTLTVQRGYAGGVASSTRGVFGGGGYAIPPTFYGVNVIDYVTIATTGNATDFGDMSSAIIYQYGACSNSTRGVFVGGVGAAITNTIEYITIATTGNSTDFGDLTVARRSMGACASSLRGIFGGGYTTTPVNVIDYITIATAGNATDFGDLTAASSALMSCSNAHGGL
jgi:hypothetical protein